MPVSHPLAVDVIAEDHPGGPRLITCWTWTPGIFSDHEADDIARTWLRALTTLTTHATQPAAGPALTSTALSNLTQREIGGLEAEFAQGDES